MTESPFKEHFGAIGTLVHQLDGGPTIHVWTLDGDSPPRLEDLPPTTFTTPTPERWNGMLMTAANRAVSGLAELLGKQVDHDSFALYPKLSLTNESQPWQMRLDGLDIGRVGTTTATLRLASRDSAAMGEPRDSWRRIVGDKPQTFAVDRMADLIALIGGLAAAWTDSRVPNAVLRHGQAEHALEAHVL